MCRSVCVDTDDEIWIIGRGSLLWMLILIWQDNRSCVMKRWLFIHIWSICPLTGWWEGKHHNLQWMRRSRNSLPKQSSGSMLINGSRRIYFSSDTSHFSYFNQYWSAIQNRVALIDNIDKTRWAVSGKKRKLIFHHRFPSHWSISLEDEQGHEPSPCVLNNERKHERIMSIHCQKNNGWRKHDER